MISDAVFPPVMQEVLHAVIELSLAETREFARLAAAGFTVTPAVWVMPRPPAVAEIVLPWAVVELKFAA